MEKTNFTLVRPLQWLLVPFMLFMAYSSASAQCVLACNDNVQVSVDPTVSSTGSCSVTLTTDMLLEDYENALQTCAGGDATAFTLQVWDGPNLVAEGTDGTVTFGANAYLGESLTTKVIAGGNTCWGSILVEDKAGPVITCPTDTVFLNCFDDFNNVPFPTALDNCTAPGLIDVQLVDVIVDEDDQCVAGVNNGQPNGGHVLVIRTFTAFDASGNEAVITCDQLILLTRPRNVDFPEDIAWYCADYAAHNNITEPTALTCTGLVANPDLGGALDATDLGVANPGPDAFCLNTSGSGVPEVAEGTYCFYATSHSDDVLTTCGNADIVFKILRTWTVIDWCTGSVVSYNDANFNGVQDAGEEDNLQIIKVIDDIAPVITMMDQVVSASVPGAHPQPCTSQSFIPNANVSDDCNDWELRIFTPVGEVNYTAGGGFIPAPGLMITGPAYFNAAGQPYPAANATIPFDPTNPNHTDDHTPYDLIYQATDECGNVSELIVNLYVIDDVAPTAVCDEITDVNLSSDGFATVLAETFDDGSNDNCCIEDMQVRKMSDVCGIPGNTTFGPSVTFCCAEVNSTVMVVFRVYDCYGNYNDCMVEVNVSDKLPPYKVQDVDNASIDCDVYFNNYEVALDLAEADGDTNPQVLIDGFGEPVYDDNCDATVTHTWSRNINSCGEGTINRTWTVVDPSGNAGPTCTQTIFVNHVNFWEVAFPADVTLDCEPGMNPGEDDPFGEPQVFLDDCELIAVNSEDQIFDIVPDACFKIIRTWTVINWCVYDGDNQDDDILVNAFQRRYRDDEDNDGIMVYVQQIKVIDEVAPEIVCPTIDDIPVDATCTATFNLPFLVDTIDCSPDVTVQVTLLDDQGNILALGYGPHTYGPGSFVARYTATDNCGNSETCETPFDIVDNKPPTPYCVGGLVVELMPVDNDGDGTTDEGMVDIWASDFDAGSFDNCPGAVKLTVWLNEDNYNGSLNLGYIDAPANLNGGLPISCNSPFTWNFGNNDAYLYVTDASGNVDFCITTLVIESNPNIPLCPGQTGDASIAGAINTPENIAVQGADVEVSGNGAQMATTNNAGEYEFTNLVEGNDYTVTPSLDANYMEGVTTYDIVLIQRHILTTQILDSEYKEIAADVNASGSITGADLVALKKVILQIDQEFANNTSWRFVDAAYNFPSNWELNDGFPEVANFNNLETSVTANFVGVKIGDVNGSWNGFAAETEDRNAETLVINTQDATLRAGQEYTVEFTSADFAAVGYQFTMNFNGLELVDIVEGVATAEDFGVFENAITTSWAGEATNDVLFALTFQATENVQLSQALTINSSMTKAEAYGANDQDMNVQLTFDGQTAGEGFALYQNTPNPVKEATTIGFDLPTAGAATITVRDMTGKVITIVNGDYAKGYNTVTLNELTNGVLTYTLETADFTATRTMVVVK